MTRFDGEPVVVNDVKANANWLSNPLLPNTQSELVLPLRTSDGIIGALDVQARTPERFTSTLTTLFQTMAEQVAMTFANAELLIRTQQQTEVLTQFTTQLNTAADVTERVSSILDPDQLLGEVGLGSVKAGETAKQMVQWARKYGIQSTIHTGGPSIPGSGLIDKDVVLEADADIIGHINGGHTALPDDQITCLCESCTRGIEIVHNGNERAGLLAMRTGLANTPWSACRSCMPPL